MTDVLLRNHGLPSRQRRWTRAVSPDECSGVRAIWEAIGTGELDLDLEQEAVAPELPVGV